MNSAIAIEMQFFLVSILSGCILIFAYDILRIFRRLVKHNELVTGIEDLIYWVLSSLFIFIMLYQQNDGIIRFFSILGMLIGMLIYHKLLSELFVSGTLKIIHILFSPIIFVINWVKKILLIIYKQVSKVVNRLLLRLKKLLLSVKIEIIKKKQKKNEAKAIKREKIDAGKAQIRKEKELRKEQQAKKRKKTVKKQHQTDQIKQVKEHQDESGATNLLPINRQNDHQLIKVNKTSKIL